MSDLFGDKADDWDRRPPRGPRTTPQSPLRQARLRLALELPIEVAHLRERVIATVFDVVGAAAGLGLCVALRRQLVDARGARVRSATRAFRQS